MIHGFLRKLRNHNQIFVGSDRVLLKKGIEDEFGILLSCLWRQQLITLLVSICCHKFVKPREAERQAMFLEIVLGR